MNHFINGVATVNGLLNNFIWGPVMLAFFLLVGFYFTCRTGLFQITNFKLWINTTILAIFRNEDVVKTKDKNAISQFQSICTVLAATIGTGNIAGVATAIVAGGPGSVFWMWLSAFLGMMTSYAENTLGIKYRYKNKNGDWMGGAMIYIERGLHCKWLAVLFSLFCALASFGIGNMTQVNSIAVGLESSFGTPPVVTAAVLMVLVALVIVGGIKRIASITDKVVPFMSIFYFLGGFIVIGVHFSNIPAAFTLIIKEAFNFHAAGGGFLGYGISMAMKFGISRGVFSNEAGLGSSVTVHSASDVTEPVIQGMWGIFVVFTDTILMCTLTALTILTTGVYDMSNNLENMKNGVSNLNGTALTSAAFSTVFPFGDEFISIAILLFAFSTLIGWSYSGEKVVEYLFGARAIFPYKLLFVVMILFGCVTSLELVWSIADTLNGFMAIPNLIAITLLSGEVITMTKEYLAKQPRK